MSRQGLATSLSDTTSPESEYGSLESQTVLRKMLKVDEAVRDKIMRKPETQQFISAIKNDVDTAPVIKKSSTAGQKRKTEQEKLRQQGFEEGKEGAKYYYSVKSMVHDTVMNLLHDIKLPAKLDDTPVDMSRPDAEKTILEKIQIASRACTTGNANHIDTVMELVRLVYEERQYCMKVKKMTAADWPNRYQQMQETLLIPYKWHTIEGFHPIWQTIKKYPRLKYANLSMNELRQNKTLLLKFIEADLEEKAFWSCVGPNQHDILYQIGNNSYSDTKEDRENALKRNKLMVTQPPTEPDVNTLSMTAMTKELNAISVEADNSNDSVTKDISMNVYDQANKLAD
jgi:hypothetical protein